MTGLTFLSWARGGPQLDASDEDPLTGPLPGHGALTFGVRINQRPEVTVHARLYGPGDVTGLDVRQIIRCDPAPDADAAEPTFFPLVEFDRPDLPWLLTPARARGGERLRPWLVLVVAEAPPAKVAPEPNALLPVLRCPLRELPDLADSWAWAHAQLATDGVLTAAVLDDLLVGPPERSLSRLLCPRRLHPGLRYVAAVVPAFEAGRKRGLGLPLIAAEEETLAPAWTADDSDEEVALPVYHHWNFATGPEGDFRSLVLRLRARPMPNTLGMRPLDVSRPARGLPVIDPADPAAVLGLEGALRGPRTVPSTWDPGAAAAFDAGLTPLLAHRPGQLGPPLYGSGPAGVGELSGAPRWLRELNLDPRYRAAAGYGAEVIRQQQEALMASAWAQAAAIARANETLRQGQLARTSALRGYQRRMGGENGLDAQQLLQISGPAHDALGMRPSLELNEEVQAALSSAFRRATRPRAPLTRRLPTGTAALAPSVKQLGDRSLTVNPTLAPAPGMVALERLTGGTAVRDLAAGRVRLPLWATNPTIVAEKPTPATPSIQHTGAAMPNRLFMVTEDGHVLSRVDSPPAWHDHGFPPGGIAASQPVAIRDLHAFVRTDDGRLCSLGWDGDRWGWQDHGQPPGGTISGRPLALARDLKPQPGGTAVLGNFQSIYLCATDGHVWELSGFDNRWDWKDLGAPPGTAATGSAGGTDWALLVHASNGHVFRFFDEGDGWRWIDQGHPGVTLNQASPPFRPDDEDQFLYALSTDSRLFGGLLALFGIWVDMAAPSAVSGVLGTANGLWMTSETSGQVLRLWYRPDLGSLEWESHDPVVGLRPWGVLRSGEPWVAADGKLAVLRSAGSWEDLGAPEPGGAGDPSAPPPSQSAWRGTVGFMSNLLVGHLDAPGRNSTASISVGHDLSFEGEVRAGWSTPATAPTGSVDPTQCAAIALANLDGSQNLVLFRIDDFAGVGNLGVWQIGRTEPGGDVVWNPPDKDHRTPTPMSSTLGSGGALTARYDVRACDIAIGDLDGDGRPELVLAYVSGVGRKLYYRIGWRLDTAGAVTGGWTESIEIPWPQITQPVLGLGIALADIENDLLPELVVLLLEQTPAGPRMRYRIGRRINGRGLIRPNAWTVLLPVGGPPLPLTVRGAALTLADFSGTQSPDIVVAHLEGDPGATRIGYRIGHDVAATGVPKRWSEEVLQVPGLIPGPAPMLAGIAVGDLTDDLLGAKKAFANAFWTAAKAHQKMVERGQQLAQVDDAAHVEVAQVAAAVRAALDPEHTVTERVTGRLRGIDFASLPPGADLLNPLAVAPSFPHPMSEPLAEMSQDLLLPGVEQVPADTVTVIRANTTFIEAYLVGLNHEFARELLWREFPADKKGTYFRQFWDARGGDPAQGLLTDIPPITTWAEGDRGLGEHATAVGGPDMVVLLIRGELLRRYPNAHVYARRAKWGDPDRVPRALDTEILSPQFRGALPPDLMFFGFPRTVAQARGSATDPGWFFVFAEHPVSPRFGIAEPPKELAGYGTAPDAWEGLDWARLVADDTAFKAVRYAPVATPFGSVTRPAANAPELTWARNSAHLAHITFRRSVEVAVHASDMLPDLGDGWRVGGVSIDSNEPPRIRIRGVGGTHPDGSRWRFTTAETVEAIRRRERFFVEQADSTQVDLVVAQTSEGVPYLKTTLDADEPTLLLALPVLPDD